jgi:putative ABC transport system permease protein
MIARWFWREWRSPSLLIVWLALSLAVACVLALGSISDRMEKGLSQQSREFMAGDRTLRSSREVPPSGLTGAQVRADRRRAAELCHHDLRRRYAAAGGR